MCRYSRYQTTSLYNYTTISLGMFKGYTDGGSRTNTHAACSWIITSDADEMKYTNAVYLGPLSSNAAEYHAIIFCMVSALSGGVKELSIYQDSELVSRQMNG